MRSGALAPYEESLVTGRALQLHHGDGRTVALDVRRWLAPADPVDLDVVARTVSPVLDVGCGPGRIVAALAEHGRFAIGVDLAARAVEIARSRGLTVLRRDVFAALPGTGRWRSIVLLDGNIGIGGDVDVLLRRMRALLAPSGRLLVETDADPAADECAEVRFAVAGRPLGPTFWWGLVGVDTVRVAAGRAGLRVADTWQRDGRSFAELVASP